MRLFKVLIFTFMLLTNLRAESSDSLFNCFEKDLYLVDTLTISNSLLFVFSEMIEDRESCQLVLFSKDILESIDSLSFNSYENEFLSEGYIFFDPMTFSNLLARYLRINKSALNNNFINLRKKIRGAENDSIFVYSELRKEYKGWEYVDIHSNRFLFFLVKGHFLKPQVGSIPIIKNYDSYYKVLVPISW